MVIKLTLISLLLLLTPSCFIDGSIDGRIYTDKVVPYAYNMNETPLATKVCYVKDFKVQEPVTGYNVQAEWMTSAVIEKAREAGIKQIHYADLRIFSILLGLYTRKTLIIYGD